MRWPFFSAIVVLGALSLVVACGDIEVAPALDTGPMEDGVGPTDTPGGADVPIVPDALPPADIPTTFDWGPPPDGNCPDSCPRVNARMCENGEERRCVVQPDGCLDWGMPMDCSTAGPAAVCREWACPDSAEGCQEVPGQPGAACEDGDECTIEDKCLGGSCRPGELDCMGQGCAGHEGCCQPITPALGCGDYLAGTTTTFHSTSDVWDAYCTADDAVHRPIFGMEDREQVFAFEVSEAVDVRVSLSFDCGESKFAIIILEAGEAQCLPDACVPTYDEIDVCSGAEPSAQVSFHAEPRQQYHIVIDSEQGGGGPFELDLRCGPTTRVPADPS